MRRILCLVCGCDEDEVEKMHCFPKGIRRSQIWQENMGMVFLGETLQHRRICSKHFTRESYSNCTEWKLLRDAAPTLFPCTVTDLPPHSLGPTNQSEQAGGNFCDISRKQVQGTFEQNEHTYARTSGTSREEIQADIDLQIEENHNRCVFGSKLITSNMEENTLPNCNSEEVNSTDICRVCLSEINGTPIFDIFFKEKRVTEILSIHLIIEVNFDDMLPQNICDECREDLLKMCSFIEKCQNSDVLLHRHEELLLKKEVGVYDELIKEEEISHDLEISNIKDREIECTNPNDINNSTKIIIEELDSTDDKQITVVKNSTDAVVEGSEKEAVKRNSSKISTPGKPFKYKKKNVHKSQCPTCLQFFLTRTLVQHMRVHTKEKPFECRVCFKTFSMNANLRRHMLLHTGERPFVCDICDKGFIQLAGLTKHKKAHISNQNKYTDDINTPMSYRYTCSHCGRKFKLLKAYNNHIKKHNSDGNKTTKDEDNVPKETINKLYECAICKKSYNKKSTLYRHRLSHGEKSFLCNVCGKNFISKAGLQEHFTIHSGEKPHSCKFCHKSFARVVSLELHLLIHMGIKPHHCKECGKSFTQPNHLRYHMLTHTGEKPHLCSYCGKRFAMKGNLTVHVRTHTGETPYVCSICNKGFYDSSNMKKHEQGHAKVTSS